MSRSFDRLRWLAMWERGVLVRYGGDTIQMAPHFVMQREQMDQLVNAR